MPLAAAAAASASGPTRTAGSGEPLVKQWSSEAGPLVVPTADRVHTSTARPTGVHTSEKFTSGAH